MIRFCFRLRRKSNYTEKCVIKVVKAKNWGFKDVKVQYFRIMRGILRIEVNNWEIDKCVDDEMRNGKYDTSTVK